MRRRAISPRLAMRIEVKGRGGEVGVMAEGEDAGCLEGEGPIGEPRLG